MHSVLERPAALVAGRGLVHLSRRLCRLVAEPWRRRAAIAELRRLNARALRDAGIERGEIESVVDDMLAAQRRIE